jgi:ABC-type uncharacterized transport system auxiliary subunit
MKTTKRLTGLIMLTAMLAACSGLMTSEQAPKQYYTLMPVSGAGTSAGSEPGPVLAVSVSAVPGLDTDRILALSPDARLNRYAGARWPDHLPEVITSVLQRSLTATGRFSRVEQSDRPFDDSAWLLRLELQQFYGIQNSSGTTSSVLVELAGNVKCNGQEKQINLSESQSVGDDRMSAIVAAHQAGLDGVTRQLLQQMDQFCT